MGKDLKQVAIDVKRAVKNAQNIDVFFWIYEIGDPVMSVKKDSYVPVINPGVSMPKLRELTQKLNLFINTFNYANCCL